MSRSVWSRCEDREVTAEDVLDEEELVDYYRTRQERVQSGMIKFNGRVRETEEDDPWSL